MNLSSCTPCTDADMTDTENAASGCLSSIRNRIFCSCRLPSDKQVKNQVELDHPKSLGVEKVGKVFVSPGIVARLMGLETMPAPKETSVDLVRRSRSVGSVNCWSEFDPMQRSHRRVRTSFSFHDIPTFVQIDENECLLVRSGNVGEVKRVGSKERRPKVKRREGVTQKKEKQGCSKRVPSEQDHSRRLNSSRPQGCSVPSRHRIDCRKTVGVSRERTPSEAAIHIGATHRERPTKENIRPNSLKKGKQAECSSENRHVQPKTHFSVIDGSRRRITNSRKKEPLEILSSSKVSSRKYSNHNLKPLKQEARRRSQGDKSSKSVYYLKMRRDVCRLVEEDVKCLEWKPIEMWKFVHVEEFGIELGLGILNRLVHEVVAELCGFPMENLGLLMMEEYL